MVTWDTKALKVTPIAADEILIIDTADSRNQKRATLTSLGATVWNRNSGSGFIFPNTLTDKVGIGTATPSGLLHIAAGTATVPPLKLTTGVYLTTLQDGVFEYKSNIEKLNFTSGGYREQINKRIASTVAVQAVKTWTSQSAAEANQWTHVSWAPEIALLVAVSKNGTNRVMTSPDGITWTSRSAAEANEWISTTWSPELGLLVAVSLTGTNRVMTSPDGITWTSRSAAEANEWSHVTWSPEITLLVAVSLTGTNRVMTSPDGITWTSRSAAEANEWSHVTWSPELGLFAAVSETGTNRVMTSPDGITWTSRTAAEANKWIGITWAPELGLFVAVSEDGTNRVMTSPDGITWTSRTAAEANVWIHITWSPELGIFVAVSETGTNRVMTSPDGITWTSRSAAEANEWTHGTWAPELGIFVGISFDGTNRVMTSEPLASFSNISTLVAGNATIGNNLTVDSNTLVVDATNNRVGIGINVPLSSLHILSTATVGQLRLGFDGSNFADFRVLSNGEIEMHSQKVHIVTNTDSTNSFQVEDSSENALFTVDTANARIGIGFLAVTPLAIVHAISNSTEQLRLGFDATNFTSFTTNSSGDLLVKPSGNQIIFQNTVDSLTGFQILDADGGTPIFNVDTTNERVGIGTATPTTMLHVIGTGVDSLLLERTANNPSMSFTDGTTQTRLHYRNGAARFAITIPGDVNTDAITIAQTTGLVGIGANVPLARLNVLSTTEQLRLSYDVTNFVSFTTSSSGDLTVKPSGDQTIFQNTVNSVNGFQILNAAGSSPAPMNVDTTNSRVGFSQNTPLAALHVGQLTIGFTPQNFVRFIIANTSNVQLDILADRGQASIISFGDQDSEDPGGIRYNHSDNAIHIKANGTEHFHIISTGFVGINTTTPLARFNVLSTSEQLRLSNDVSNFTSFTTSSSGDLTIAPSGGDLTLSGNLIHAGRNQEDKGADVASATIITLGSDGNFFDITGFVGINEILATNWQAGSQIVLQFDDTLTITNNSGGTNDILSFDGANIITSAGMVLGLRFNGTDWIETFRNNGTTALLWKNPVRLATLENGTFATSFANGQTIDGTVLVTGDRILIKNQTDATTNGIYTVNASGAPTRAIDFDHASEATGAIIRVLDGTMYKGVVLKLTNIAVVTIGSTALEFRDVNDNPNLKNIYVADDFGIAVTAPDGISRVPLIGKTTYLIHNNVLVPRLLVPVATGSDPFPTIDFISINSNVTLLFDGNDTAHIWGRDISGVVVKDLTFVDIGNSGAGNVTNLWDLVGINESAFFAVTLTVFSKFKRVGSLVNIVQAIVTMFLNDNLGGFVNRISQIGQTYRMVGVRTKKTPTATASERSMMVIQGQPESLILTSSQVSLASGDGMFELDNTLTSSVEIVANSYAGTTKGNFFQPSKVTAITAQANADVAFASVVAGAAGFSVITFAAIQDFTIGQVVLIAGDVSTYDGLQTITAVSEDQMSFTIAVTFVATTTGNFKMVQHTVAANPYSRDGTVTITGTTSYNATLKILRETNTTFHLPQTFVANDATGTTTSNPQNQTTPQVKAFSNGAQADAMITAETHFLSTGGQTVTIGTAGTAVQIGTTSWTSDNLERATVSTAGVITYLGTTPKDILVNFSATIERVTGTPTLGIGVGLFKNGALISGFDYARSFNAGKVQITGTRAIDMVTNDTLEIVVINFDNTTNIDVFQADMVWNAIA